MSSTIVTALLGLLFVLLLLPFVSLIAAGLYLRGRRKRMNGGHDRPAP